MSYMVHDLLKIPLLSEARIVAGENGQKRLVKSVSFLEGPDSINWVMPHDFLLTNAYLLYENPTLIKTFINELADKNASAIGIKLNRYMQSISEDMIRQAEETAFPIIILPFNVTPSQLIGAITRTMYTSKTSQRKALEGIQADLMYDFFSDLLFGKNISKSMMLRRATSLGWDFTKAYSVMLIQIDDLNYAQKMLDVINNLSMIHGNFIFQYGRDIFVICEVSNQLEAKRYLAKYANDIKIECQSEMPGLNLIIDVGRPYNNLFDLNKSYEEAKKAQSLEQWAGKENSVTLFDNLGLYKILCHVDDDEELEKYYQDTVAKLEKHDQDNDSEYCKTMEIFVECNGNYNETAKRLYLHYNTVKYRISVIKKILAINIEDPEERFNFQIGMKIAHLLKIKNKEK